VSAELPGGQTQAVYTSKRPEDPSTRSEKLGGGFNEGKREALTAEDVLFTTKSDALYAFVMGWPEKQAVVQALGTATPLYWPTAAACARTASPSPPPATSCSSTAPKPSPTTPQTSAAGVVR
jgi:hypothetical protein